VWGYSQVEYSTFNCRKEHLEQIVKERTAEVVAQKEEIEFKKKRLPLKMKKLKVASNTQAEFKEQF
jgi:hypothetical protein